MPEQTTKPRTVEELEAEVQTLTQRLGKLEQAFVRHYHSGSGVATTAGGYAQKAKDYLQPEGHDEH
jgi:hypothetical protein